MLLDPSSEGVTKLATASSRGEPEHTLVLEGVRVEQADVMGGDAHRVLREHAIAGLCLLATAWSRARAT